MNNLDAALLQSFLPVDEGLVDGTLAVALAKLNKKIVVLDDDPTGVQTVHDITVFTGWDEEALTDGFAEEQPLFFVLTNSRSFSANKTGAVHREIGKTLCHVAKKTRKDYILISRSDSTLRGHFPLETLALRNAIEQNSDKHFDGEIIIPFFLEGGRYTINNVHYVQEENTLIPAGETEFAKDKSFGFQSSHLGEYVEEKTKGEFKKEDCTYISLSDLRHMELQKITQQLLAVRNFGKIIVNAVAYVDVKIFALAYLAAVQAGKEFLFRSAAAVPKVLGGISNQPLLSRQQLIDPANKNGGIVLVGSHVNKTTQQLEALHQCRKPLEFIEFNQHLVVSSAGLEPEVARVVNLVEQAVCAGKNVAVYTCRKRFDLDTKDKELQLKIAVQISDAITCIIARLTVRPNFIIAKGGITSSDVGTKALRVKKALVMGQIKPGVPVWMTGEESKFPQMPYVIFPGNVGTRETLREIVELLQ